LTAKPLPVVAVNPQQLYNRLQDLRAITVVLDLRSANSFERSHISGARHLATCEPKHLATHIDISLADIRGPLDFVVVLCHGSHSEQAGGMEEADITKAAVALSQPGWAANASISDVWSACFEDYQQLCPFACSDHTGFEEYRLLPALVSCSPRVYLSPWALAADPYVFGALRPTHIVNCTPNHANVFEDTAKYLRVPVVDDSDQDLLAHLDNAVAFISDATHEGGTVLCHCRHGQSRSASVLAAWLITSQNLSVDDAVHLLKSCRPRVSPNPGFRLQLSKWRERTQEFTSGLHE